MSNSNSNNNPTNESNAWSEIRTDCAMWYITDILGKRWNIPIIIELINAHKHQTQSLSYTDLAELLPTISSRTLTRRLKNLVELKIIIKIDNPATPKKVRYKLSRAASELVPVLRNLRDWGARFGPVDNKLCINNMCRHVLSIDSFVKELKISD